MKDKFSLMCTKVQKSAKLPVYKTFLKDWGKTTEPILQN